MVVRASADPAALEALHCGNWVYAAAGVVVIGSLPVLGLNIARVARREWRRHRVTDLQ
jgi:hypothetical protein